MSVFAIVLSAKAMKLPYKQDLKIYTAMIDNDEGKPELHITLINVGNWPMYLDSFVLEQKIMAPLVLGYLDEDILKDDRVLSPQVVHSYIVPMQNYNSDEYCHYEHMIKLIVNTTNKTYSQKIDWTRG